MADDDKGWRTPGWPDEHMLEAAMGLLANAVAFDPSKPDWERAKREWMDAYHRHEAAARRRPLGLLRGARQRWVAAGGPQALAQIGVATVDSALAVLSAVVPGKNPPGRSGG